MSKHFCCCLPVRLGVFILSFLSFLGSAGVAFGLWWLLANGPKNGIEFEGNYRTGFIVTGVVYSVFALVSLLGFIGAIIRSRFLVRSFSLFLWLQLVLSLAISIFFSVALFRPSLRNMIIDECAKRLDDAQNHVSDSTNNSNLGGLSDDINRTFDELKDSCASAFNSSRVGFVIGFCVSFLINLYCCIIVHRYGNQLSEEQAYKASSHPLANTGHSKGSSTGYYPHQPLQQQDVGHGSGHGYSYPYAQSQHGFGSK